MVKWLDSSKYVGVLQLLVEIFISLLLLLTFLGRLAKAPAYAISYMPRSGLGAVVVWRWWRRVRKGGVCVAAAYGVCGE